MVKNVSANLPIQIIRLIAISITDFDGAVDYYQQTSSGKEMFGAANFFMSYRAGI
jgi:hypothetical protein